MRQRIAIACVVIACVSVIFAVSIAFTLYPGLALAVVVPLAVAWVLGEGPLPRV